MKSIRQRLSLLFLAGFGVLWILAGAAVCYSYRAGLLAGMESELQALARQVRMNQMVGGPGPGQGPRHGGGGPSAFDLGPDIRWQIWFVEDGDSARSDNLTADLPRLNPPLGGSVTRTLTLDDGVHVMLVSGRFGMGERGAEVAVARDLAGVRRKLLGVFAGILIAGLAGAGVSMLWVFRVVREGLSPIRRIADKVEAMDADSLGPAFEVDETPIELHPIVTRLNGLMERLEEGIARERRFSSDLSHEIRTPIAELRMIAESALKWPEEAGQDAWKSAVESLDRMENVTLAMLRLARLERSPTERPNENLPLRQTIEELWKPLSEKAAARRLELNLECDAEIAVVGDPTLWRNVLGNLLGNAADYADEGSQVAVSGDRAATDRNATVRIGNSAGALKQEDVARLFDRFWRGDTAREESAHCGLGLPLARACAEAMGLRISAARRPNDGWLEIRVEPGDS